METVKEGRDYSFPEEEQQVLQLWDHIDAFHEQLRRSEGKPAYVFYDGPPFATGLPHYGHLLAGTLKDVVTRYATATGHYCPRRFGWDCHGLPVEHEIDKAFGINTRSDVLAMGIDNYNEECRSIVMRYSKEWEKTVRRIGRWIDFENDYKTLDPTYMESVWWVFKQLWEKGLVYRGFKVMPYSTGLSTPLANFEANQNYKDTVDPSVMVAFSIDKDPDDACFIAWTTTPWTLPSNLALCVNPEFMYVRAKDPATGKVYIVAESRLASIPGAVPKAKKGARGADRNEAEPMGWQVLSKVKGKALVGTTYQPLFPYFAHLKAQPPLPNGAASNGAHPVPSGAFRVISDAYVKDDSGTGVVHQAPAFGEDDFRICIEHGIVGKGEDMPCPVDGEGRFTPEVTDFAGRYVKEADKDIIKHLRSMGRLIDSSNYTHSYPFCWRSDTPLIQRAVPSWFVRVTDFKEDLMENNRQTYWVPNHVKEGRFANWLANARDWCVSRSRFWGTPIPIWASEDLREIVVVGSIAELEELTGEEVTDLHRHMIDHLTIPSRQGKGVLKRVDEVFDCWFESGSMPYAQLHYPFENKEFFEGNFPADFVAEGQDQTRGWFYTLMVLSTALFNRPAFKNLVCNGLVLADDGKKMSKRLKNYPDPNEILDKYGADALRLYLVNSPVVHAETLRFKEEGVFGVIKNVFMPWYNAYRFLVQNVLRLEADCGERFYPLEVDVNNATNILDRWIAADTRRLTAFVRVEMDAYRLYTVVPDLVRFIENLTNIYVRYNRTRLKGRLGVEDCKFALASLFDVLLTVCKVMAPFTPFFCETLYQNLRRALPKDAPESVHWCDFPLAAAEQAGDKHIVESVARMQRVIEMSRIVRERHGKPLKMPLRSLTVVSADASFLDDLRGELRHYVLEEVNVRELVCCDKPDEFGSVRAVPDFKALGKRLGRSMAAVGNAVRQMDAQQIAEFESKGSITLAGESLSAGEIKVQRDFKRPEGMAAEDMDACAEGDVMAVLDMRPDDSLRDAGLAREVVNRVQKLRKKAGLQASDLVDIFVGSASSADTGPGAKQSQVEQLLDSQGEYIRDSLGREVRPLTARAQHAVVIAREHQSVGVDDFKTEFDIELAVPVMSVDEAELLQLTSGDKQKMEGLKAWLVSKDPKQLSESLKRTGGTLAVHMDSQRVSLQQGKHFHL
ncbi:g3649 [Coccomyxa viridis]|uniref:isoleucine--tRNA ligase n=1 Tax=Coccomyxa viridis TaxID=1274662 RepID=A0ABP1FVG6_9CHLO